jgi:outer membrane cobalamin receptor
LFLKLGGNFQDNYENYQVQPILNSYYLNLLVSGESELHYKQDDFQGILAYNYTHATLSSNQLSSLAQRNQHAGTLAFESVFFDVIRFFPSIRADIIPDENKKVATYKLGVNIRPFPNSGFSFRGNYGKNFRMPTFNDMYWKEVGTKSLNPEFSYNIETGIRYENSGFVNYCIDGTLTRIDATDKIVWMPQRNGIWRPQNIAKSVSKVAAINANIEKTFPEKLRIRLDAGLLFTDSRKTDSEYQGAPTYNKLFPYIPVHTAKLSLLIEYNQVSANFFFTHTGNKYSDQENLLRMPQYNVIDGNIAYAALFLGQSITTRLEINNITDQDYQVIADYPMPLRTFTLSFTLSR